MAADELGVTSGAQHNPPPYPTMIEGAPWDALFLDPEYGTKPLAFEGWLAWHYACYVKPKEVEGLVDPVGGGGASPALGT